MYFCLYVCVCVLQFQRKYTLLWSVLLLVLDFNIIFSLACTLQSIQLEQLDASKADRETLRQALDEKADKDLVAKETEMNQRAVDEALRTMNAGTQGIQQLLEKQVRGYAIEDIANADRWLCPRIPADICIYIYFHQRHTHS